MSKHRTDRRGHRPVPCKNSDSPSLWSKVKGMGYFFAPYTGKKEETMGMVTRHSRVEVIMPLVRVSVSMSY